MNKLLQFFATTLMVVPMLAIAHGPTRQQVKETVFINAAPEQVWEVVSNFGGLNHWHPAVTGTEMKEENIRILTLNTEGNPTITEELDKIDNEKMMMVYTIEEMSVIKTITFNSKDTPYYTFPVNNYKAWLTVKPKNGGSEVTWKAKFYRSFMDNPPVPEGQSDQDAVTTIKGFATAGLNNLKAIMEK